MPQLTEQDVRRIIKEELKDLLFSDRYVFHKTIQILGGRNIQLGTEEGTKFGTASTQLLGFYGATPVDRPTAVNDAPVRSGSYSQSEAQSVSDSINTVIDRLQELGLLS